MRALAIDDSRAIRFAMKKFLEELGFEVTLANDGKHAMACLEEIGSADIALVDWNMPEMNGLEFIKAVRADPKHKDMLLMMVTTEGQMEKVVTALEAGANEYLMKPFTKQMVEEKLQILGVQIA